MVEIFFSQWRHTSLTHKHTLMIKWLILAKQRRISPNWCPPGPTFNQSNPSCSLPVTNWHSPQFDTHPIHTNHLIWNREGKIVWKPLIIEGINQGVGLYDRSKFLPTLDTYWIFPFPYDPIQCHLHCQAWSVPTVCNVHLILHHTIIPTVSFKGGLLVVYAVVWLDFCYAQRRGHMLISWTPSIPLRSLMEHFTSRGNSGSTIQRYQIHFLLQ